MKTYKNIWDKLCSMKNLELAFKKARKNKTLKPYVKEFEKDFHSNLLQLRMELLLLAYRPRPLKTFIIHDPKTRKISKSDFRDRIIHHTLVNILEPIFDKSFIYDSYANRKGKGTLKAIQRFDCFKRKVSKNNTKSCYVLKADIKHYFETVDHEILIRIIKRKIKDERVIWLIKQILNNFKTKENGMPLGNLTSQFFANIYLNRLDQFIKHKLRLKYYIRYVDDFVVIHISKEKLERIKNTINNFLKNNLRLELHPDKSKILTLKHGIPFLGFRVFYFYKLLKKNNIEKMKRKILIFVKQLSNNLIDYDKIYASFEGWLAYTLQANTNNLRKKFIEDFEIKFKKEVSSIEVNRLPKSIKSFSKLF
ncbi:group II intron reverse transcriptase domain-containing protein [Candidatus Woesearchaeota archaeon]|nr:group II intron reverse transcriptase domain-containing protein [Candidatus Woesearchaeota archaeon]